MDPTVSAILCSWSLAQWLTLSLLLSATLYLRGWLRLRRRGARQFGARQLICFLAGLGTVAVALMSPLDALAPLLMQAHMLQHLLLMLVAPPLILLAQPELPMIAGLPAVVRRTWVMSLWQLPALRRFARWLTQPATAWLIAVGVLWLWHVPAMYEWTLRDRLVHDIEHFSFLASSILFWWPVLLPYPHRRAYSVWLLLPYLFLAGVQGTVLSGLLTFSDHVLYPHYEAVPRLWGLSALSDQAISGAIMWTIGSLAYLVPLVLVGRQVLKGELEQAPQTLTCHARQSLSFSDIVPRSGQLPVINTAAGCNNCSRVQAKPLDVLRVPIVGPLLQRRQTRTVIQCVLLAVAMLVVLDGLFGPQVTPLNLAGVGPWIHWRWLLVVGLLAAGNVFCFACPFTLPRRLAAAWLPAGWNWPKRLSNKWPAVGLLLLFFWAYELFALWDSPWWTAWIVVGYFAVALTIDGLFRSAPFCRYVCPIGQFNFVYSLVSPLEVQVRDPQTCAACESHACLHGRGNLPGCEMGLFQPQKQGNLDCTFCLDCVRSCPHDNVGVIVGLPGARLATGLRLEGGRSRVRGSVVVLVIALTAAALLNAAWMTGIGTAHGGTATTITFGTLLGLTVIPFCLFTAVAMISRRTDQSWRDNLKRFVLAFVPLGLGMWGAHYTYHFLTGAGTLVTAAWRMVSDLGLTSTTLSWACPCCSGELSSWLLPLQFIVFDAGLLLSLYTTYAIARRHYGRTRQAVAAAAPWAALQFGLFALGVLILLEPMQMRGAMVFLAGGGP